MFKIDALGTFQGRHYAFRTSLGRFSRIYETLDKLNCFYFLVAR